MIEVKNLEATYEGMNAPAVKDVSFTIEPGTFFSLVGPSGCGKTTTLRSIAGLETPDAGEISLGGALVFSEAKRINVPAHKRGVGMVFQSYAIWPHMTVSENVAFPLMTGGSHLTRRELAERVDSALALVGLSDLGERDATRLSGGQQQRLALARALVRQPQVLLLDEPLSNLDAKLREHMRAELRSIQKHTGITTLYVTHDQEEALSMSDRVAVMNNGEIVQEGRPEIIYSRPQTEFVANFVGTTNLIKGTWRGNALHSCDLVFTCPACDLPVDERGAVSVRPEDIMLAEAIPPEAQNVYDGVVTTTTFLGNHFDVYVRVADRLVLRAFRHHGDRLIPGQRVKVHIVPNAVTVLRNPSKQATDMAAATASMPQVHETQ